MDERVFTAEEVNAALKLADAPDQECYGPLSEDDLRSWWEEDDGELSWDIAALALGVLPDGWRKLSGMASYGHSVSGLIAHYSVGMVSGVTPEAVRSGQYDIAGRLIAAHVELERRRMEAEQ